MHAMAKRPNDSTSWDKSLFYKLRKQNAVNGKDSAFINVVTKLKDNRSLVANHSCTFFNDLLHPGYILTDRLPFLVFLPNIVGRTCDDQIHTAIRDLLQSVSAIHVVYLI
ncbi:hypothetical protein D3C74_447840 [compost metagenome]